ncbi:hypothetical protein [Campylobacter sp. RM12651]|uniref:hypothetical protein n=1 Tax=Campylobacter sp. RM12651 TaxID=1660079 RepID=UPI001EFBAAC7|nr:hypothetical protein [Campylobacter sp. RM12651]ULO03749.1 hypothetical protein AVBRAN_1295 [Campylobacter sp. RM12651]
MKNKSIKVYGSDRVIGSEVLKITDFIKLLEKAKEEFGEDCYIVSQFKDGGGDYDGYYAINGFEIVKEDGNTLLNFDFCLGLSNYDNTRTLNSYLDKK